MGVFDKLKNIFFEEEYVEVEEKPKKKEKSAIAKKIELSEMPRIKEEKTSREKEIEEEVVERVERKGISDRELRRSDNFKFPMNFEDDYFEEEKVEKEEIKPKEPVKVVEEPKPLYGGYEKKETPSSYSPSGLYEGGEYKKEQKLFRPTPIISPIYGVLDKNYTKEEIVQKKDIKLSSENAKKINLDEVREKAYGADVVENNATNEVKEDSTIEEEIESSLYDLNDDNSPAINKVTVGDAEEYYSDLGLEYNVDYKDSSKEKATGRRTTIEENEDSDDSDSNLFDLIDSMYSDSDKE